MNFMVSTLEFLRLFFGANCESASLTTAEQERYQVVAGKCSRRRSDRVCSYKSCSHDRIYVVSPTFPTGNFSGTKKTEEIMVARGSMLELLRIDPDTDKLVSLVLCIDTYNIAIIEIIETQTSKPPQNLNPTWDGRPMKGDSGCPTQQRVSS